MSTNVSFEFVAAQKKYNQAKTMDEKIAALEEMISTMPAHKGAESMRANLRTRLKNMIEKQEKSKKTGKTTLKSVKKEGFQVVLIGYPNSGKSSLLSKLTNARPQISPNAFTTKQPEIGTMYHQGVKAQIVDLPSIGSEYFDAGIVNTADLILIVIRSLADLPQIIPLLKKTSGKQLIAINKSDLLSPEEIRKLEATIKSKKIPALIVSALVENNIEELKNLILKNMAVIRVYTKEPGKTPATQPCTLPVGATVRDVAESILKGFSKRVKETRLTGPSSKFPNQRVGLSHVLKDLDIVEFHTK